MRSFFAFLTTLAFTLLALSAPVQAQDAPAMRAQHAALAPQLRHNAFGRPVYVESSERSGEHKGTIYAVIERPFERVAAALRGAAQWCNVLIVQPNVKDCEALAGGKALSLFVARKPTDPPDSAYRVDLRYEAPVAAADYLRVWLGAPEGPFGTKDYRLQFEAAALDERSTFLSLGYSYRLGGMARMGLDFYLATSGRDKVGFSVVRAADGRPIHVGGVRGVVERNAMRYFLALEAHLQALDAPAGQRLEKRLRAYHAGLERHPRQLRELDLGEYLQIKRQDALRAKS